jgi:Mrp family chromosome partitioning ATPase
MEFDELAFAVRRFWLLVVAIPAVAVATALLLAYSPATKYTATSSVIFQPASADVDLRLVQFVLPSVPLEVGTDAFQNAVRESIPDDAAHANWTLSATADTTSGLVTLSADGLNPDVLPVVANAAAAELIDRRETSAINVSVLDASNASVAEAPRRTPILFGAAVLGGIIGIFAAIVGAHLNPRFRRPEDVADRFGLRLLGEVPRVRQSRLDPTNAVPDPALGDFFKRMRLSLGGGSQSRMVVALVSHSDGDGKSTVAANLATAPLGRETSVAVVDTDLQQPSLERYFGVSQLSAPSGDSLFIAHSLGLPSQDGSTRPLTLVMPAGTPTTSDTLVRGLPEVLRALDQDTIIVDTASLDRSADGLVAAKATGRAVLVVDIERQSPDDVEETVRLLREANVEIRGLIVNRTSRNIGPAPAPPPSELRRTRRSSRSRAERSLNPLVRRSASRTPSD